MKTKISILITTFLLLACGISPVSAQEQDGQEITISLRRDFGYALGSEIQGTFTVRASGPDDLSRVLFLIDSQPLEEVFNPPFQVRFNTGSFEFGNHTLNAIGYTQDGREVHSQSILVEFVSPDRAWQSAFQIVVPILAVIIGAIILTAILPAVFGRSRHKVLPLGAPRSYGLVGGTICPKCGRPFGMHLFGINLLAGKLDRCPHCGRWSLVRRASPQQLAEAEAAELRMAEGEGLTSSLSEEEKLRKTLEDSRYQDL